MNDLLEQPQAWQMGDSLRQSVGGLTRAIGKPGTAALGGVLGLGAAKLITDRDFFDRRPKWKLPVSILTALAGGYLGWNAGGVPKTAFAAPSAKQEILQSIYRAGFPQDTQAQAIQALQMMDESRARVVADRLRYAGGGAALAIVLVNLLGIGGVVGSVIGGLSGAVLGGMLASSNVGSTPFQAIPFGTPFRNYL